MTLIQNWRTPLRAFMPAALLLVVCWSSSARAASDFTEFETGQVRPLALSPDGARLFAVNTPDNRLEIFDVAVGALTKVGSVPVGLEPLAVAARTNDEVWVVNHLSDSVSVVDVSDPATARVVRTLLVGDEPRDIVFGGPAHDRAFITTAHRGQNTPLQATIESVLTTPGIGRADVWVFDANAFGATLGGTPQTIVTLFSDTPRALAVTPDGHTVYAAAFHSGNRTTTLSEGVVPDGGESSGGLPEPNTNFQGIAGPEVGLIVKFNGSQWVDELGRNWSSKVRFSLPDEDVFAIDADAEPAGAGRGAGRLLRRRRHDPLQHGGEPGEREGLRHQPRVAEPASLRGSGHLLRGLQAAGRAGVGARAPGGEPDHGARRRERAAAAPEQAHRLRHVLRGDAERRERRQPGVSARHGGLERRRDALRGGARDERDRGLRHGGARGRHVRAGRGGPDPGVGRRADGPRARRGAQPALRADAVRRRGSRC